MRFFVRTTLTLISLAFLASCRSEAPEKSAASQDAAFTALAGEYLEDIFRRQPTQATDLGIHKYDDQLENYSRQGVMDAIAAARGFRDRVNAIDPSGLSFDKQLDREQLLHAIDSRILMLAVVRPWAKDADSYSSGLTNTAYVMIKRRFAPPEERLRKLIAREKAMPAALLEARKNIETPPQIYTQIAIEQIDGNRSFFESAVPGGFKDVKDQALLDEFKKTNDAVIAALVDYKKWLQDDLLKRSKGEFAFGQDTFRRKLSADEMIDVPLDELLTIAERDLRRNQASFAEVAHNIDAKKTPDQVLAAIAAVHPAAPKLLEYTQKELDAIGRFMTEHHIITIPSAAPARVQETPPFLRATTSASMDIPGPFEKVATEAYYNMTLPDPKLSAKETEEFMGQWYYAAIANVSVHEVWPGHYLQFLYARDFPSDIRKVFGAATNSEGWAHYCEQMVVDEGFHRDDPRYRLAQIQDALLRNARFIVGIRMHTRGMTVQQAEQFFIKEAYQPPPVARSEAKRGTSDATYGYYTMGKLMILKLRDDYKAKKGAQYSLQDFHDSFIKLGPLPLPLMRKAMLGEAGNLF
ncbi:MAG TPA: DUF885 domain-containing protein [Vicinamibacterales bacterium]|nr:DUF885 domain-containing protein [Vicinamibacterales bacterium]